MIAGEIRTFPDHRACVGIQTSGAQATKVDVDPSVFHPGGRGRVTVKRMAVLRIVWRENDFVMQHRARLAVQAENCQTLSIHRGGGQPDAILPDHRGRPPFTPDGRLPGDVLGFTPSGGNSSKGGSAIAMTASKLVPVRVRVRVIAKTDRVEQAGRRQG